MVVGLIQFKKKVCGVLMNVDSLFPENIQMHHYWRSKKSRPLGIFLFLQRCHSTRSKFQEKRRFHNLHMVIYVKFILDLYSIYTRLCQNIYVLAEINILFFYFLRNNFDDVNVMSTNFVDENATCTIYFEKTKQSFYEDATCKFYYLTKLTKIN